MLSMGSAAEKSRTSQRGPHREWRSSIWTPCEAETWRGPAAGAPDTGFHVTELQHSDQQVESAVGVCSPAAVLTRTPWAAVNRVVVARPHSARSLRLEIPGRGKRGVLSRVVQTRLTGTLTPVTQPTVTGTVLASRSKKAPGVLGQTFVFC